MATIKIPLLYDELLDYLIERATPEEILAFAASEEAEARAAELLEKNNAGTLTPEEQVELQQLLYVDRKVSVLKAKAAAALK